MTTVHQRNDSERIFLIENIEAMADFAVKLGRVLSPGMVICLEGQLGAGKTALVQLLAKALDVPEECYVTSPTFAIVHEYPGVLPIYHMDFYRLQDATEVIDGGFSEYFYLQGLCLIEWGSRALEALPEDRMEINLQGAGNQPRQVTITALGNTVQLLNNIDFCSTKGPTLLPGK